MISVILPTINGRENLLKQTITAFEKTTSDLELIIVRNHPTCGEAWNAGVGSASGEHLLLGADDLLPHEGWAQVAVQAADMGVYPAPWIQNPDGSTECCGTLGCGLLLADKARDGLLANSSPIPFLKADLWNEIGPTLQTHYYADDYLGYRARAAGLSVEVRREYRFTHLDGTVGKQRIVARSGVDRLVFAEAVSAL